MNILKQKTDAPEQALAMFASFIDVPIKHALSKSQGLLCDSDWESCCEEYSRTSDEKNKTHHPIGLYRIAFWIVAFLFCSLLCCTYTYMYLEIRRLKDRILGRGDRDLSDVYNESGTSIEISTHPQFTITGDDDGNETEEKDTDTKGMTSSAIATSNPLSFPHTTVQIQGKM